MNMQVERPWQHPHPSLQKAQGPQGSETAAGHATMHPTGMPGCKNSDPIPNAGAACLDGSHEAALLQELTDTEGTRQAALIPTIGGANTCRSHTQNCSHCMK